LMKRGITIRHKSSIELKWSSDLLRKHGGKTGEPVAEAAKPEPPTVEAADISIHEAANVGNIEAVKQHLAAGTDVNAKADDEWTPLFESIHPLKYS